jgi:TATA-box binding protein (TBP) (component of TFIID and TFIIIB)
LLTRYINIYEQLSTELDDKAGGVYNLEFYGNCARGETTNDTIKTEFNNQATIKFKYWAFRNINIKIFANGKLQMTGLKYENEAKEVALLLINILKNIKINVTKDINTLAKTPKTYDFQLVYDSTTNNVYYYRKYYNRFLSAYEFDTNLVNTCVNEKGNLLTGLVNYNRKDYVKGIHDKYLDTIEDANQDFLVENQWNGDGYVKQTIEKIEKIKDYFTMEMETTLSASKNLKEVKQCIESLMKKYTDFKFPGLDKFISDIGKDMFSTDEQTLIDIKNEIFKFNRAYRNLLEKKINRLIIIRTIDISICNYVKEYIHSVCKESEFLLGKDIDTYNKSLEIPLDKLEIIIDVLTGTPTEQNNYFVSDTETVLINSDLSINHNINLKKMSKVLRNLGLYNSYEPDEYHGVLTKYYYNLNNTVQGICNCDIHCSTREKHSICTKITISIFRPGSIIITGARNLTQLMSAHDLILKVLKENLEKIKGPECDDDNKHIALMNNEFRKISRKTRLFYIKKDNIIDYDKVTE